MGTCGVKQGRVNPSRLFQDPVHVGQQLGDVVIHDVLNQMRLDLIVGVNQNVPRVDDAAPGDLRVRASVRLFQLVGGLTE